MSFELVTKNRRRSSGPSWSSAAFIVEAMLLLVFLVASMAVFTQLFAASATEARESRSLTSAVTAATATAERFAADPVGFEAPTVKEGLALECEVTSEETQAGTLYYADIRVFATDDQGKATGGPIYKTSTARYVSEVNDG